MWKEGKERLCSYRAGPGAVCRLCACTAQAHPFSHPPTAQGLYKIAGLKGQPVCFIFTDADVKDEAFLEYINQLLMTGATGGAAGSGRAGQEVDGGARCCCTEVAIVLPASCSIGSPVELTQPSGVLQVRWLACSPRTSWTPL